MLVSGVMLSTWALSALLTVVCAFDVFTAHEPSQLFNYHHTFSYEQRQNFRNFKLVRITPRKWQHLEYLRHLYEGSSPYQLNFWQPPSHVGALVDVVVSPQDASIFVDDLKTKRIKFIVAINDLQQAIDDERSGKQHNNSQSDGVFHFDRYNRFDIIEEHLRKMRDENPEIVTLIEIGKSYENRSLTVVKLGTKRNVGTKDAIWIDGGIHAREWIAPAVALNIINELIASSHNDSTSRNLLNSIDWYILPVMNPDGYEYSHTKNRMWRKNRRPNKCRKNNSQTVCCIGVDLNRNFDWFWASSGSSADPCHETYHGTRSFSEPESNAVKEFLELNPPKAFITLHSYSQMWLIPYGHRRKSYPNDYSSALKPLANRAMRALRTVYGTKYSIGTGADLMYEASGSSQDWAKGKLHVPYAYLIELRPKSVTFTNGFLLPEHEIKPTSEEIWVATKVIAEEILTQSMRRSTSIEPVTESSTFTVSTSIATTISTDASTTDSSTTSLTHITDTTTTDIVTTTAPNIPATTKNESFPASRQLTAHSIHSTTIISQANISERSSMPKQEEATTTEMSNSTMETSSQPTRTFTLTTTLAVRCVDDSVYCKWWQMNDLCRLKHVQQLCTRSCHFQCTNHTRNFTRFYY